MEKRKYEQLCLKERIEIYRLHADGKSLRSIAGVLGRSAATISRELKRNSKASKQWTGGYDPERAQQLMLRRYARGSKPQAGTSTATSGESFATSRRGMVAGADCRAHGPGSGQRPHQLRIDLPLQTKAGKAVGVMVDGKAVVGYNTPSRKLELFSKTLADWKWPEFALPESYRSHVHRSAQAASVEKPAEDFNPQYMPLVEWPKDANGEVFTLLPILRLPHLIHARSGNSKFLYEIAHTNPLWLNPTDAQKLGDIRTGDLIKVHTEIGFFVLHAWITEGLAPGVVACSHHMGRWRTNKEDQIERMSSAWVDLKEVGKGQWKMRQTTGVEP
jgi:anaerobic selenocysteine-containing dehydrogenase